MINRIIVTVLFLFFILNVNSQSLNSRMSSAVAAAVGGDIKGFKIYSYPTDNFGVITSYDKRINDKKFLCDTWHCIGLNNVPQDPNNWLTVNGFVATGGGGPIELDEQTKKSYALSVALPKIADILNINAAFDNSSTQNISLTLGKAYKRKLLKDSLIAYFNKPEVKSLAKDAFNSGRLRFIVSDWVIENMSIVVTLDATTTASLESKLADDSSKVFNDASLSFKLERLKKGTYKFSMDKPLIYAVLSKRQPSAGSLGSLQTFDDWIDDINNFPLDPTRLKHTK